jgi:putative Mg2+ transporter-C (MgtC) family protein
VDLGGLGPEVERLAIQLGKLLLAFGLCFPMAWDREHSARSLGVRTFPLVAVGSCAFVLISQSGLDNDEQALSRVLQGIIAGIGFLGGGAIVKQGLTVKGAATAAAVWATAALGVAVAVGEFGIAVALGLLGFGTLRWLKPLKRRAETREGNIVIVGPYDNGDEDEDNDEERREAAPQRGGSARGTSEADTRGSAPGPESAGSTVKNVGK